MSDEIRKEAWQKARSWLSAGALILDTETTGLGPTAEIVEIAIIDTAGAVLLDTLVKPVRPIPAGATAIHGITNAQVEDAPDWTEVQPLVSDLLVGLPVVIYNAGYDCRLIEQTARRSGLPPPVFHAECAMLAYARFWQQWDDYRGDWRWQKLTAAAMQQGVRVEGAHRALADCFMTLEVVRSMASENSFII